MLNNLKNDFLKYFFQGFKVAYVVFRAAGSVQRAKKMSSNGPHILSTDEYPIDVGLKSMYQICSIKNLLINLIDIWVFLWPQILRNEAFMYISGKSNDLFIYRTTKFTWFVLFQNGVLNTEIRRLIAKCFKKK